MAYKHSRSLCLKSLVLPSVAGLALMGALSGPALAATVPDVTGMTFDLASESLSQAGLGANTYREDGSSVMVFIDTNWRVSAQDPLAGTEVEDGSSISVNLVKLSNQEADAALASKNERRQASGESAENLGKASIVSITGDVPPDGRYSATIATEAGDIVLTVTIEDGLIVAADFAPQSVPAAEEPPAEEQPAPEPEPEVPMGMQNAVRKADSYLRFMAFSVYGK